MIAGARSGAHEVAPDEAREAVDGREVHLVIDAREPMEFREAHLPDAVNIPRGLLELRADPAPPVTDPTLSDYHSKRLLVYCTKDPGVNSLLAAQTLSSMGYENVDVLRGGLPAWDEAGLPVDREPSPT